jgi:hypothetical protein
MTKLSFRFLSALNPRGKEAPDENEPNENGGTPHIKVFPASNQNGQETPPYALVTSAEAEAKQEGAKKAQESEVFGPMRPSYVDLEDYKYLRRAITLKEKKVQENYSALITEFMSDAQTAAAVFLIANKALFTLSLAPFAGGILPVVMLCAAVPAVLSLVSEIKKDNKDLQILQKIDAKFKETEDEDILANTKIFVKMHAPHHYLDAEDAAKEGLEKDDSKAQPEGLAKPAKAVAPVKVKYHDMKPSIRMLIEENETVVGFSRKSLKALFSRQALYTLPEKAGFVLSSVFNAFALSIRACTVDVGQTLRSTGRGFKEVGILIGRDRSAALGTLFSPTLYESLVNVKNRTDDVSSARLGRYQEKLAEGQTETPIFNKDSMIHIRKLHTLQLDLRNNTKQRFVTAGGAMACFSFVSLAMLQAGVNAMSGRYVEAAAYVGLSAMLSVPALRVLCERLTELAENDRDSDVQMAMRLAKLGL